MTKTRASLIATWTLLAFGVAGCKHDPNDMAIKAVEPPHGTLQGDQPVKIEGRFRTDIGYTVYFGTKRSEHVSVPDEESLVAVTPRQDEAGAVDIIILADNGPAYRIRNGFMYEAGGGNVVEQLGSGPQRQQQGGSGHLAY